MYRTLNRAQKLERIRNHARPWDMIIIGGGATGAGVAVDAAARGYEVVLLEQSDFGKGTSSRSTKLVHGGVRYLERGDVPLVMEALRERGIMRRNAPHLVSDLAFVVPVYAWWEGPFYGAGLRMYNILAGKYGFGKSRNLSKEKTLAALPTIRREGLRGGVIYYDGQFDDMRFLISLLQTAAEQGATLLNYVQVTDLKRGREGVVDGVVAREVESGETLQLQGRVVINATGAFVDAIRTMAEPKALPMIAPSQGIHLVFDKSFLPGNRAIMVPHTSDGRVMFAIPWNGHTLIGTTDTPISTPTLDPVPLEREIDFILQTASLYLHKAPSRRDVLSMFAGIRPLVKVGNGRDTAALSRDHTIRVDESGLLTITGGKWTTYRNMAEDCVNHAAMLGGLDEKSCVTKELNIHGYLQHAERLGHLSVYGSDATALLQLSQDAPHLGERLHPALPYTAAQVVWAVRHEYARTLDDVLSRRTRATFLNVRAALEMAPRVAALMAEELERDADWQLQQLESFRALARGYLPDGL
ncbi:MAG: glycerol-3-phosphate dehydrogenase/oxidase [Deltaproteobacteria bacterium]|nr:glycerol-3-phosphate dehydrogenase/oxidase [Deltaproteobacteria bacterium]